MNSSFPIAQLSEDHDVLGMELQAWGLIAVLEATEEEVGRERVDEVFDSWGIDVRGLLQRRAWTTLEFAERFMDAMVGLAGEHIVHRAGWRAMSPRYLGPIYPLLRAVGSIRGTIHQIAKQGPRFNKAFHQSVSETGPGQVVLRFVLAPGVEQPRTRHFFTFVRAQAEAVPALFGGRPASVREQQLGRTTEFNVEWDEEGLSLPNWPLYPVSVLAVFIAALAAGVGTGAAVAMSLFGGAATHFFYEARRRSDEALRYLNLANEYREGLVESARESESRFGDLLEAKAGVEREVAQRTSELKATSEQLAATLDEVRKLSQARTDFFSNVSHELRTPLTLLLSPLGQLVRGQEPPGGYEGALASMERNATRLLNTINQLLDLEQIDARRMKLKRVSVAPLSLLHAVEASFAAATEMKGVTLSVTGDHGSALMLDSNWMETALTNLTANALKFTQAGDTINLSVHDQGDEVVFEVRDSGEGIAPHELDSLFERFTRGAGSKTGTGIGLSLVHEAARLHGGRVNVRSTVGEGSTFHLHIPRVVAVHDAVTHSLAVHGATPDTCVERSGPDALAPLVFVAEDNPDVRTFIADVLSAHYRVRTFRNGGEVLDAVVEKTPDAFIVDVNMPVVGGLDLTSALRKTAGCEDTPIVLVTARGEPNQVVEGFHAGVNDYVIKPFHARELLVRTDALVRARETTQRLIRREQLATVGMVAASVAHQVRNPLNALISGLSAVRTTLEVATSPGLDPPTARMFDVFLGAAQSIDSVSADLLYLSRSDRVASQRFAPGRGLAASVRLMEARFADSVEIDHAIDEEAEIEGYPGELHQVFISLLDNAARAMIDGGRVRVLGRANETLYEIAICDSGPGLPDGVLQQVLEGSLATGAFPSRGMGLTVAAGVAKRNGGAIYAGTSVYGGAEIRLTLPLAAAS